MPPKAKARAKTKAKPALPKSVEHADHCEAASQLVPALRCPGAHDRQHQWQKSPPNQRNTATRSGKRVIRLQCVHCECFLTVNGEALDNGLFRWTRGQWILPRALRT